MTLVPHISLFPPACMVAGRRDSARTGASRQRDHASSRPNDSSGSLPGGSTRHGASGSGPNRVPVSSLIALTRFCRSARRCSALAVPSPMTVRPGSRLMGSPQALASRRFTLTVRISSAKYPRGRERQRAGGRQPPTAAQAAETCGISGEEGSVARWREIAQGRKQNTVQYGNGANQTPGEIVFCSSDLTANRGDFGTNACDLCVDLRPESFFHLANLRPEAFGGIVKFGSDQGNFRTQSILDLLQIRFCCDASCDACVYGEGDGFGLFLFKACVAQALDFGDCVEGCFGHLRSFVSGSSRRVSCFRGQDSPAARRLPEDRSSSTGGKTRTFAAPRHTILTGVWLVMMAVAGTGGALAQGAAVPAAVAGPVPVTAGTAEPPEVSLPAVAQPIQTAPDQEPRSTDAGPSGQHIGCPTELLHEAWAKALPTTALDTLGVEREVLRLCDQRQRLINSILKREVELARLVAEALPVPQGDQSRVSRTRASQPALVVSPAEKAAAGPVVADPGSEPGVPGTDVSVPGTPLISSPYPARVSPARVSPDEAALSTGGGPAAVPGSGLPGTGSWSHVVSYRVRAGGGAWLAGIASTWTPPQPLAVTGEDGRTILPPALPPEPPLHRLVVQGDTLDGGLVVTNIDAAGVTVTDSSGKDGGAERRLRNDPGPAPKAANRMPSCPTGGADARDFIVCKVARQ